MAVEVKIKKWGNSMGILLPRAIIEKENLNENDEIIINVVKKADLRKIFGSIRHRKLSGQDAKDMMRLGWRK